MKALLNWTASLLWSTASALARATARPVRLDCPRVISVGNIQVGGAGKTPLVALIAREARERGLRACILCRGYGGEWEARGGGGVIEPGSVAPDTALCGDEAALLHELAPDAWIGVGADRASAFESVRARAGKIDVAILDDGFQHHRLARDIDVVAVTGASRAQILFRDFTRALKRASLIVYTKGEAFPCAPESIPAIRARYELPQAEEGAAPLCLVTGLADGAEVQRELERKGYRIAVHIPFRDHARYDGEMVNRIVSEARKQRHRVATTGKDWVKWRELGLPAASDVLVLEPAIRFERIDGGTMNENLWNRIVWSDPSH